MTGLNVYALFSVLALAACLDTPASRCGNTWCSTRTVCAPSGDRCVSQAQIDVCAGRPDGMACSYTGVEDGACANGACIGTGCGNGVLELARGEVCDDGNRLSLDGCSGDCRSAETCGDGVVDGAVNELCDAGDANADTPGATCRTDCRPARCGDGIVDPGETCDDGNTTPGDGCRADCGGRWTAMQTGTYLSFTDVWGSSMTHVWALAGRKVMRWDGNAWTQVPLPNAAVVAKRVWGTGPSDVWVRMADGTVYRYDGEAWTPVTIDPAVTWRTGWSRSVDDVWIVGEVMDGSSARGRVAHWDGLTWTLSGATPSLPVALADVWASNITGIVWATDDNRNIYRRHIDGTWVTEPGMQARLVRGAGSADVTVWDFSRAWRYSGSWSELAGANELVGGALGIGRAGTETIAAGAGGAVLACGNTSCAISPSPTTSDLRAAWVYEPGRAFIVGDNGTILY